MLIGFNNDVDYKGRMFHIQTEDNGIKNASITTILFFQGQILDRKSGTYADVIEASEEGEPRKKMIKKRMVELHRALYKQLFDGDYEERTTQITKAKAEKKKANKVSGSMAKVSNTITGAPAPKLGQSSLRQTGTFTTQRPLSSTSSQIIAKISVPTSSKGSSKRRERPTHPPTADLFLSLNSIGAPPKAPDARWHTTGQQSFLGATLPKEELRVDLLVAHYLDSLS